MTDPTPSTPQSKSQPQSQLLPPHTQPVQRFTSQSDWWDLALGRKVVLEGLGRYLRIPYSTLICSAFGPLPDPSQIRQKLTEEHILNVLPDGMAQWAGFETTPAQSGSSEVKVFQPFVQIISKIFDQLPNCQLSCFDNPSATPLSERRNTSRPDAYIVRGSPGSAAKETHWGDIVVPFEFKKTNNQSAKLDNERKIIWSLHNIMREDPLRRFALGITIEDTMMRLWYNNRAFLAVSEPIHFTTSIDDFISLFHMIGDMSTEGLGWDPTVERILVGGKIQYKFTIANQVFTTTRPLSTYGADAMVGRGTRVYEARDENGKTVAIKDSWRDEDCDMEGTILEKIFKDIRKLGEKEVAEAEKYVVKVRVYEDVVISGEPDKTFIPLEQAGSQWITITVETFSAIRHLPSAGHIPQSESRPTEPARGGVRPRSTDIRCRVHTRTVFEDVGTALTDVTCLADSITCLSDSRRALYYLHKAGWVHRDFSPANVIWVEKNGEWIGKLTDFEYAKKVDSEASQDVRTGTMHFMAAEVESQYYLFNPTPTGFNLNRPPAPPFRMNFLHDLESNWWTAIWVLLYHTDADSPTENPQGQSTWFDKAFPRAIGQTSRRDFFTSGYERRDAYVTLSTTYKAACRAIMQLAFTLQESYKKAEELYPELSLSNTIREDVHNKMLEGYSDALGQLKGLNIRLCPLHKVPREQKRKNIDDSPTTRMEKKARRGE